MIILVSSLFKIFNRVWLSNTEDLNFFFFLNIDIARSARKGDSYSTKTAKSHQRIIFFFKYFYKLLLTIFVTIAFIEYNF